ncbi:MAG: putative NADH:ubiquinone oxidoreductase, subunit RnfA [Oscillospiraceae bacterium]|jgi:electron transport complex protein RnfA|nr:putative NADH:ubiquinone oxidoreductase, subunit RnfA [Oscillospiraceae bacterium]
MKAIYEMMAVIIVAAVTENLLFARALGVDHILERTKSYRAIIRLGAMTCVVSFLGGILAWVFKFALKGYSWWPIFRGLSVLLSISMAYFLITVIIGTRKVKTAQSLPVVAAFNGASFGAVLIAILSKDTLLQTIAYCLGCSAGLTIAMMLVHSGRERLELCKVPKSFNGLPITMIYIGILSLAIYGLIGHQLPT